MRTGDDEQVVVADPESLGVEVGAVEHIAVRVAREPGGEVGQGPVVERGCECDAVTVERRGEQSVHRRSRAGGVCFGFIAPRRGVAGRACEVLGGGAVLAVVVG